MSLSWQQQFSQQLPPACPNVWRDLAWLLISPDLLRQAQFDALDQPLQAGWQALQTFLQQQQSALKAQLPAASDDASLVAYLEQTSVRRLGLYGERLLAHFFTQQHTLLAHGLQVRRGKSTLGEFDFLLQSAANGLGLHMELACKYYLCVPSGERELSLYDYLGPNLADSLGAKLTKIAQQQLHLSREPEGQEILRSYAREHQLQGWMAFSHIKGCLFYRYGQPLPAVLPELAAGHARGLILELDELDDFASHAAVCLERLAWLAPRVWSASQVCSLAQLKKQLVELWQMQATPQMVALLDPVGGDWQEVRRAFVVPPGWWQRASALDLAQRREPGRP